MVNWVHHLFGCSNRDSITFTSWAILTAIGEPSVFLVSLFNVEASCLIVVVIMMKVSFFAHFALLAMVGGTGLAHQKPNGQVHCVEMYQNSTHT